MKVLTPITLTSLILLCIALFTLPSCTTDNGSRPKGLTLHELHLQMDQPWIRFQNMSLAGNVTTHQQETIQAAYKEFETLYKEAVQQAGGEKQAKQTLAPENVKAAAEKFRGLVDTLM